MQGNSADRKDPGGAGAGADPRPAETHVLRLIGEHYALPLDLLGELLGVERRIVVGLVKEFTRRKWVDAKRFFVNDEPWVWLRKAGAKHSGTGFDRKVPTPSQLPLYRSLCEIRLSLEKEYPDGEWISARFFWKEKSTNHHVPNAVFRVPLGEGKFARGAIEVERTEKSTKRYQAIVTQRRREYDRVLFYCTPRLAQKLEGIAEFKHPKVQIHGSLKELSELERFQWRMSPASRPKRRRSRKTIKPWEGKVVRLIAEQYAMPVDQFARLVGYEVEVAQRIANHLDVAGFIDQGKGPVDQAPWLWVTPVGTGLAETGLTPSVPPLFGLREIWCMNEARLYMRQLDPRAQWWSKAMLLRGNGDAVVPAGVVREGDKECAVEIEPGLPTRTGLVNKYERRYAEHRSERRGVLVLCTSDRIAMLEELKQEYNWANLHVEACPAFDKPRTQPRKPTPLVRVGLDELPEGLLDEVRRQEGTQHLPDVTLAGRRKPRGLPRWRITTELNVWCVTQTPLGWSARKATEREKGEELLTPETPVQREVKKREPKRGGEAAKPDAEALDVSPAAEPGQPPASQGGGILPFGALKEIQKAGGPSSLEAGLSIMRDPTADPPRWRVELGAEVWWVTEKPKGGCTATPATGSGKPKWQSSTRVPRDPDGVMRPIDVSEVPQEARDAIQREADSRKPPEVLLAEKRRGSGSPRWRLETNMDTWRVTHSPHGWLARPSE